MLSFDAPPREVRRARSQERKGIKAWLRDIQLRAWELKGCRLLLIQAPPGAGKSRAFEIVAIWKCEFCLGIDRIIIAVPDSSIGASFGDVDIRYDDLPGSVLHWRISGKWRLCPSPNKTAESKLEAAASFLKKKDNSGQIMLCSHATLRGLWKKLDSEGCLQLFDRCVVGIDEIHHSSADGSNQLGDVAAGLVNRTQAHVVAMTGSFFRGDGTPVLSPQDERKFQRAIFTWQEQIIQNQWLHSMKIGYIFYKSQSWLDVLEEACPQGKKTIVYLPAVNSSTSSGDKHAETKAILAAAGTPLGTEDGTHCLPGTNIFRFRTAAGREVYAVDLVTQDRREKTLELLHRPDIEEKLTLIAALGLCREGFDWPACERVVVAGPRSSLTEMVQIFGRAARDYPGKSSAEMVNVLYAPNAAEDQIITAVNDVLKATVLALLMMNVFAPQWHFRPRSQKKEPRAPGDPRRVVLLDGPGATDRVLQMLDDGGIDDIILDLLSKPDRLAPMLVGLDNGECIAAALPAVIEVRYKVNDLTSAEQQTLADAVRLRFAAQGGNMSLSGVADAAASQPDGGRSRRDPAASAREFLRLGEDCIDVAQFDLNLIDAAESCRDALRIASKPLSAGVLEAAVQTVDRRFSFSDEELKIYWRTLTDFKLRTGRVPSEHAADPRERRMAQALRIILRRAAVEMREDLERARQAS